MPRKKKIKYGSAADFAFGLFSFVVGLAVIFVFAPQYKMENMSDWLKSYPALLPPEYWYNGLVIAGVFVAVIGILTMLFPLILHGLDKLLGYMESRTRR